MAQTTKLAAVARTIIPVVVASAGLAFGERLLRDFEELPDDKLMGYDSSDLRKILLDMGTHKRRVLYPRLLAYNVVVAVPSYVVLASKLLRWTGNAKLFPLAVVAALSDVLASCVHAALAIDPRTRRFHDLAGVGSVAVILKLRCLALAALSVVVGALLIARHAIHYSPANAIQSQQAAAAASSQEQQGTSSETTTLAAADEDAHSKKNK